MKKIGDKLKKTIALIIILIVGIMMIGGCDSAPDQQTDGQGDGVADQPDDQDVSGDGEIPSPPALPEEN